jgi:DNA-binding CsgD family transcriptional regulator
MSASARLARLARTVGIHRRRAEAVLPWGALTRRELEVAEWLTTGATDQQIGRNLGVSARTVGKHLEAVYRKLGLSGRAAVLATVAVNRPVDFYAELRRDQT